MTDEFWALERMPSWYDLTDAYVWDIDFYCSYSSEYYYILEMGAGTGRITIPLSKICSKIVAVEKSRSMLDAAREKASSLGVKNIDWRLGDMTDRPGFSQLFDLAIVGGYSFSYLHSINSQKSCLDSIYAVLAPGGSLVIACFLPKHVYFSGLRVGVIGGPAVEHSGFHSMPNGGNLLVTAVTRYDSVEQELHCDSIFEEISTDGSVRKYVSQLRTHVYYPREIRLLLEQSGFEIFDIYGDFEKNPLTSESCEMILHAKKPKS